MKLLHTADLHIRDKNIEECEKVLSFLVETARAEAVDLVVIAGDTFDSADVKLDSRAAKLAVRTISALADICPVAIVLGTPSHDGRAPEILSFVNSERVRVATVPTQFCLWGSQFVDEFPPGPDAIAFDALGIPRAVLTLIPQPTKQFWQGNGGIQQADREIGAAMSALFAGFGAQAAGKGLHILVYHGGISGAQLSAGQVLTGQEIEVSLDQLALTGAWLNLCGHIHLPQRVGDDERTFYAGSIYPNNWGESHRHGFYVFEMDGEVQINRHFIDTPHRKMVRVENDFTSRPVDLSEELSVFLSGIHGCEGAFVRCDFRVWQDEAGKLDKEKIRAFYLSAGAVEVDVRIIRVPRETVRAESVLRVERLRDKLTAMAALKEETVAESVLAKADALEEKLPEDLIAEIGNGKGAAC